MTDPRLALIVEWASRQECPETRNWDIDGVTPDPECGPCVARLMLGPLKCACGVYELLRWSPSLYVRPVYHKPDACAEPAEPTHCSYCRQPLPKSEPRAAPPKTPEGA